MCTVFSSHKPFKLAQMKGGRETIEFPREYVLLVLNNCACISKGFYCVHREFRTFLSLSQIVPTLLEWKVERFPTPRFLPPLSGTPITAQQTLVSISKPAMARQELGLLKQTTSTSGFKWTLTTHYEWLTFKPKAAKTAVTSGSRATQCPTVKTTFTGKRIHTTDKKRLISGCFWRFCTSFFSNKNASSRYVFEASREKVLDRSEYLFFCSCCFQVFLGNTDKNSVVTQILPSPIFAQYIRINPRSWVGHISMRAEFLGCHPGKWY